MKNTINHSLQSTKLLRIISSALMFVILLVQVVQAFHNHSQSRPKSYQNDQSTIDLDYSSCSICYYLSDTQSNQLNYAPDNAFVFISQEVENAVIFNLSRVPDLSLPGFTNKGPPAI